jgi:hypothetical protein
MHLKTAIHILAATLLLTARPAMAFTTQTAGSQILVMDCTPHIHTVNQGHPWIDPYGVWHYTFGATTFPAFDAFLGIAYKNQARMAAKEIDFGLVARGSLIAMAKDVGTFSPGIKIDHEFVESREIFPIGTTSPVCAVLRVKYADGSEWKNPSPPQP